MYTKILILSFFFIAPLSLSANEDLPLTGRYSVTTEIKSATPLPVQANTSEHCLKTEDFSKDPASILAAQPDAAKYCEIAQASIDNGQIELLMNCNPEQGKMKMNITGSYTKTSYTMNSDMQLEIGGMTMSIQSLSKAKRVGDC